MKHAISVRWLANPKCHSVANFLVIFEAWMNILFIVKARILRVFKWSCRSSQLCLTMASRLVNWFWAHSPISSGHMSLWCPILNSNPSIHQSNGNMVTPWSFNQMLALVTCAIYFYPNLDLRFSRFTMLTGQGNLTTLPCGICDSQKQEQLTLKWVKAFWLAFMGFLYADFNAFFWRCKNLVHFCISLWQGGHGNFLWNCILYAILRRRLRWEIRWCCKSCAGEKGTKDWDATRRKCWENRDCWFG